MTSYSTTNRSIRVLSANTGTCYHVSLPASELTVENIRRHLAAAVPPSDQILLLGPPYKVPRDSVLQSEEVLHALRLGDMEDDTSVSHHEILSETESTGAKRLFLFSKQSLSHQAPDPPPCVLGPMELNLPTETGPSPLQLGVSSFPNTLQEFSPLHQALEVYERRFRLFVDQGRVLADGADLRLSTCRSCLAEQAVLARALRAAVSNLSVHVNGTQRLRTELTSEFQVKISSHASLLSRFETLLTALGGIPLHPSFVSIARASGRVMETLLDTVPVEQERSWATQCQISHQRLITRFADLENAFAQLGTAATRQEEAKQDSEAEASIKELWKEIEDTGQKIRDRQSQKLERLTRDHNDVVKVIKNAFASDSAHSAFPILEELSKASVGIIPSMQEDDDIMKKLMEKVAQAKTLTMRRMKVRLREVSVAQSAIQTVNFSVAELKDALMQQCENMLHLEHLAELPSAYRDFICEIRRRRAFGGAVTSTGVAMMERLSSMRNDEVKEREKFLRGSGRHLMPAFFEIFAPTLATPPPIFSPQLPSILEMDTLPDVGPADNIGGSSSGVSPMQEGISSASSLTAVSNPPKPEQPTTMVTDPRSNEDLIVSADQTDNEEITDPSRVAAADAERKTLAYENAVLRQAIERMGTKSPRTYIDEAKDENPYLMELEGLRNELISARAEAQQAKDELAQKLKEIQASDKISHSSFSIGDFALFMPTGRGSGGKRTYLAFHTGCPHYYLSTDNIRGTPDFVLGRIIFQEPLYAGEPGTDANPYGLHVGTKFYVNTVEVINPR